MYKKEYRSHRLLAKKIVYRDFLLLLYVFSTIKKTNKNISYV